MNISLVGWHDGGKFPTPMISPASVIEKKRDGQELHEREVAFLVESLTEGALDQAQLGAFLMACYLRGLSQGETQFLTKSMLSSGKSLSFQGGLYVDKHSTGGVGDKTTFIVAPLAAACGARVPMISGRGLGHTGGTIDKLESIPGFRASLSLEEFQSQVEKIGLAITAPTKEVAPADGVIYQARDVTATVNSIPLIVASIMSKKLAEGAQGFVFDVKVGQGAFMPTLEEASRLAQGLALTGQSFGKKVITYVTDMNCPLGEGIGHTVELMECLDVLRGEGPEDVRELSQALAAGMVVLAGLASDLEAARGQVRRALEGGKALEKFLELVSAQGGGPESLEALPHSLACERSTFRASREGWVSWMDTKLLGEFLIELGGGRKRRGDHIDHAVGAQCLAKVGHEVCSSAPLLTVIHHKEQKDLVASFFKDRGEGLFQISPERPVDRPLIKEIKSYL